jgi:hypothetical protein
MPLVNAIPLLVSLVAAVPGSPGPTLAREDTMHTEVPEVLVRAPRVTLDEILDRVARGEARRDSSIRDQAFTATLRVVRAAQGGQPASVIEERVFRVYRKKPNHVRSVLLREWKSKPDKHVMFQVNFRGSTSEEIVNFAFRPEARREYKYRIMGRDLRGDHLVYRIAFEPRSPLDPSEPSGLVWIDTNDFVIVRQEVSFKRSPAPLFIRGIERMVIERQRSEGHWVLSRILMRAQATIPMPRLGRAFDFSLHYDEYAINAGMPDSLFAPAASR